MTIGQADDSAQLVRRVEAGETEVYGLLVRRHQAELYRYARGMRLDHDTAVDMVQEAFVSAYTKLDQCEDPAAFRAWIYRILRNTCLDWLKNIRRSHVALEDVDMAEPSADPLVDAARSEQVEAVRRALDSLTEDLREAFLLKHHQGLSYSEMMELTGASESALKMRVHRARDALREMLEDAGVTGV